MKLAISLVVPGNYRVTLPLEVWSICSTVPCKDKYHILLVVSAEKLKDCQRTALLLMLPWLRRIAGIQDWI